MRPDRPEPAAISAAIVADAEIKTLKFRYMLPPKMYLALAWGIIICDVPLGAKVVAEAGNSKYLESELMRTVSLSGWKDRGTSIEDPLAWELGTSKPRTADIVNLNVVVSP